MTSTFKKTIAMVLSLTVITISGLIPETVQIPIAEEVSLTASAEMVGSDVHQILFDYIYYADKYSDLKVVFDYNKQKLWEHWLNFGKREGRSPSSLYDATYYRNKYIDLRNAFGNDYVALYNHFVNWGIREGRQASPYFSVEIYKQNYADLRQAFGTSSSSNLRYLQHWREWGLAEHRNATSIIQNNIHDNNNNNNQKTTTYYVKTNGVNLNVRSNASTSASVVGKLSNGSSVEVFSISGGWAKIKFGNSIGYVSSTYLTKTKISSNWQWPVATNRKITQTFGHYYSPMSGKGRPYHCGIDIADNNKGTPAIFAAASGTIKYRGYTSGNGNHVIIQNNINGQTVYTLYSHLSNFKDCPAVNASVSAGQRIGTMGSTGNSTGNHLHFSVFTGRYSSDPVGYATSPSSNKMTYNGTTFYNPEYVIAYKRLP